MINKKRILTGDRPTGRLHLGHYIGSLQNRVKLQHDYETLILIADVQALTTHFDNPDLINDSIFQVAVDNLAVGLDPNIVTFIQQSRVNSIAELTVFFSMFVSVNVLRHNPTIKTEAAQYGYNDLTYGFLGYPISQTADILFCNADLVPVGDDQLPHMELTRKIVRRFNDLYGTNLKEPKELLSNCPRLMGLDGNTKMGKSLNNAIYLSDSSEIVIKKINAAKTDESRIYKNDIGHPDICTIATYQKIFNVNEFDNICNMCKLGSIGCKACKERLIKVINDLLDPIRDKHNYYYNNKQIVRELIESGVKKANEIGNKTCDEIKKAMRLFI